GHAAEGLADIARRGERIGIAVRPFRIDIDETHLHGGKRVLEVAVAAIALIREPFAFPAPIDVLVRFPDIGASAGKAEGLEAHGFEGNIAGEIDEVGPGDLAAVFLLDRPQEPAGLVEIHIVGPGVERRKTLLAATGAATPVTDAVCAGAVPGHADEQ